MRHKKRMECNKANQQNNDKLSVLMMEYNNFHDKVKWVIQSCSTKTIQALVSLGVLFGFCINGYYKSTITFFVDVSMCILIPILSLGIICISLSTNIQVLAFGEYLITIEKKINQICTGKKKIQNYEKVLNWEQWRIEYGIARDRVVYYDSAFLYVTSFIAGVLSPVIRIIHMGNMVNIYSEIYINCWLYAISLVISLIALLIMVLLKKTVYGKKRIDELLSTEDIVFGEKRTEEKISIVKLISGAILMYIAILSLMKFIKP